MVHNAHTEAFSLKYYRIQVPLTLVISIPCIITTYLNFYSVHLSRFFVAFVFFVCGETLCILAYERNVQWRKLKYSLDFTSIIFG